MAGGEGFEPSTPNLGGWCSIREQSFRPGTSPSSSIQANCPIRTELLAQQSKSPTSKEIPVEKLFKIEKVALYLEGKGKQSRAVDSFKRHISRLARAPNSRTQTPKHNTKIFPLTANTNGEWIVESTTDKERAKQLLSADFLYKLTTPD
jgi:hypothetical protein